MVSALRGAVASEWLDGTYVLIIRMTTSDRNRSAELANAMARYYILDQLETKFEATRQATDWLTERVADLRIDLEEAEQSVENFSSESSLISEEALGVSARQLKDLRERATALGNERSETTSRLKAVEASRAAGDFVTVATLMREPRLTTLAAEIARLDRTAQDEQRDAMIARFDADFERGKTRMAFAIERLDDQEVAVRDTIVGLEAKQDLQANAKPRLAD
jgi:succinoglycan biosynthesis transport protein ExoP